jgi:hypothetical protein
VFPGPEPLPIEPGEGQLWIGEFLLHLHNARDWPCGTATLVLSRDNVRVWLDTREVSVLVRDHLRAWFYQHEAEPFGSYGLLWSYEQGWVCLRYGTGFFTACPQCLSALEKVL